MANPQAPGGPENEYIASIANDVRRVVLERPGLKVGEGQRDVHRRHHGCVWAWLEIAENIDPSLAQGVFQRGKLYPAWVRFSSSSKREQADPVGDGRGIAIKLLRSELGAARAQPEASAQPAEPAPPAEGPLPLEGDTVQDFTLLNGPSFFARDAREMALVARLEADDAFPSSFFVTRIAGLAALAKMAKNQANSLLGLTYHSQAPFRHGKLEAKYRLLPRPPGPSPLPRAGAAPRTSENYLFEALRAELEPSPGEEADAQLPLDALLLGQHQHPSDIVFDFQLQVSDGSARFPIDDATVAWPEDVRPFVTVAELRIPRQKFGTVERMAFSEALSFNPWHCQPEHLPLGSLNAARRAAYLASFHARETLNHQAPDHVHPSYTLAEWQQHRAHPGTKPWQPRSYPQPSKLRSAVQALAMIFPRWGTKLARFLASPLGYVVAPGLLVLLLGYFYFQPKTLCSPLLVELVDMPSERLIPPTRPASDGPEQCQEQPDVVALFRYFATGSERHGGLPYWIYRVLPRMLPQYFGARQDWSEFGLELGKDGRYDDTYESYHELPRGLVLSNVAYRFAGNAIGVPLKVVSFNCASCHRGEYLDEQGARHFVDGMPNLSIDTSAYKVASVLALRDERFNAPAVIAAINQLLAEEARERHAADGQEHPSELSWKEELVYRFIVSQAKAEAEARPIQWILHEERPHDGFGRLDAFGALRFEFMKDEDRAERYIATVDLPSIWQQGKQQRPWHHYDGNTEHARARNFGAIVGVGGNSLSIRAPEVLKVGEWIDQLQPPRYPFPPPANRDVDGGELAYTRMCASCHGLYSRGDPLRRELELPGPLALDSAQLRQRMAELNIQALCIPDPQPAEERCPGASSAATDIGTDRKRAEAVDPFFVERLNAFGVKEGLWDSRSFRSTGRYIAPPLDGIWARAPYLHNGSVPTLWHLLGPARERPQVFYRANPKYDPEKAGFDWEKPMDGREHLKLDARRLGNCNLGHTNRCQRAASDEERAQLIAYLKTL